MAGMFGDEGDKLERLALLPHPRGMLASEGRGSVMSPGVQWGDWIAPQWLASMVGTGNRIATGDMDERDALNVALGMMGGGMLTGRGAGGMTSNYPWRWVNKGDRWLAREIDPEGTSVDPMLNKRSVDVWYDPDAKSYVVSGPRQFADSRDRGRVRADFPSRTAAKMYADDFVEYIEGRARFPDQGAGRYQYVTPADKRLLADIQSHPEHYGYTPEQAAALGPKGK